MSISAELAGGIYNLTRAGIAPKCTFLNTSRHAH